MFNKIKDNIGLIVTGIALLSSVGAGVSAVGEIVTTLTNRVQSIKRRYDG